MAKKTQTAVKTAAPKADLSKPVVSTEIRKQRCRKRSRDEGAEFNDPEALKRGFGGKRAAAATVCHNTQRDC